MAIHGRDKGKLFMAVNDRDNRNYAWQ